ncbi:MAG TPA: zinc ribbon domain-containing protein [Candidatus Polarisedimenticolaceae bacterium]|nr:zinc ribbon domain-containing protein [Candidatus Polarisedimenticolaceae bacterium]
MPIYEYRCRKCGHTLEKIQKVGDPLLVECPACQGPLEKLISTVAVQFKGGGWYADGYSGKGGAKGGGSDAGTEGGGGKKDGGETKKAAAGGCGSGSCGCH